MTGLSLACDCGAVTVAVGAMVPELNACSCRYCARSGARWAYSPVAEVRVTGATKTYQRARKVLDFHRCVTCGDLMFWTGPNPARMGVNMAHADPNLIATIPVVDRFKD